MFTCDVNKFAIGKCQHKKLPYPTDLVIFSVPSGAPVSFTVIPWNATVLQTTWSPPPLGQQNGPIIGYALELIETASGRTRTNQTNGTTFQWDSLRPDYAYQCRVAARTEAGQGPYTEYASVEMPEAGMSTSDSGKGSHSTQFPFGVRKYIW